MVVSDRVARRKEATRQRIVDAAMELFLAQGFDKTSVAQISEAADIGKGTFFTYFETKQEVLSFLGVQVMSVMLDADDASRPAADRLRAVFAAAAGWFDENGPSARQMCIARMSGLGDDVPSSRGRLLTLFTEIITDGMDSGDFRRVDRDAAITLVVSAYFAPVAQWTWQPDGPALADRLATQLDLALAALAP